MSRQQWIIVGIIAAVAAGTGLLIRYRTTQAANQADSQSQLPAEENAANYSVPPNIGMSVDRTGGANFPMGESGFTYTVSQAQSLPSTGSTSEA